MKFLPNASFASVGGSGRLPAETINKLANEPRELTATVVARGALAPVLYGRRDVPGMIFAWGKIGTDLVVGYLWCMGEVDAVEALYLNDEAVPAGVSVTHYTGTPSQGVDATLTLAVAAYNDTMRYDIPGGGKLGVCYSVVRIPVGTLGGFPRARAVIRGRKVLDPRTGTTAYSANPALHLNDLITNPVFGLGRLVVGINACANWCDTELGGLPGAFRARSSIYIAQGQPAEQYIDLLCEYAECLRVYEGSTIKLVPDAPVDLTTARIVGPSDIVSGTFSLTAESSIDTPTEVELQYTEPALQPEKAWALVPVVVRLPGVTEGETQRIPTSITLDGVYRHVEASNKALARLERMQGRMTATWTTLEIGVTHQRGDVVKVQLPARGVNISVRIESVAMSSYGRYQVSASRYDVSHYPSDVVLPGGDGFVPVGAIGMLVGTTVPPGWEVYGAANGRYIVGAGGALSVGATGGSNSYPVITGTSTPGGAHTGSSDLAKEGTNGDAGGGAVANASLGVPDHTHTFSIPATTSNLFRRENVLVIKVGAADLQLPPEVRVFGLHNMNTTASIATQFAGRLLSAAATNADAGATSVSVSSVSSEQPGHKHSQGLFTQLDPFSPGPSPSARVDSGAAHSHTLIATLTANVNRYSLTAFGSATPYSVRAGMIFMWPGTIASIPADYVLCDGTRGTPDMRGRFAEFGAGEAGISQGDNTVIADLTFSIDHHSHDFGNSGFPGRFYVAHASVVSHTHRASALISFTPEYYALAFIMYAPAGI